MQVVEKGKTKGGNQKRAEGEKGVEDHSDGSDDQLYEDNKGEASEHVPGEVGEEGQRREVKYQRRYRGVKHTAQHNSIPAIGKDTRMDITKYPTSQQQQQQQQQQQ